VSPRLERNTNHLQSAFHYTANTEIVPRTLQIYAPAPHGLPSAISNRTGSQAARASRLTYKGVKPKGLTDSREKNTRKGDFAGALGFRGLKTCVAGPEGSRYQSLFCRVSADCQGALQAPFEFSGPKTCDAGPKGVKAGAAPWWIPLASRTRNGGATSAWTTLQECMMPTPLYTLKVPRHLPAADHADRHVKLHAGVSLCHGTATG
jgi:hypothetical protein